MNNSHNIHYYFNDGSKTYSKILALEEEKNKGRCNLYYHDDLYDNVNWKVEPIETLNYHYITQAKKIRDEYDYLILCYSGGIDSTNILETFYFNQIKLNKIVSLGALSQDSFIGDDTNQNGELYYNVFPYIKKLGLENIFQILDYTKYYFDLDKFSLYHNVNWINEVGSWLSPHHWFWRDLHRYVIPSEVNGKKIAIIFGKDKPRLNYDNGYYFDFPDSILNSYGFYKGYDNIDIINFYWDPTYPKILIKQLHILKKFKDLNQQIDLIEHKSKLTNKNQIEIGKLIYDLKTPLNYISPKSVSTILSIRDSYLLNKKNSNVYEMFSKGVKELNSRIKQKNIPHRFSKKYYIT